MFHIPGHKQLAQPDFAVANCGSIMLLHPISEAAQAWVAEHLVLEGWQYFGSRIAIERRYIEDICDGIESDGLKVV